MIEEKLEYIFPSDIKSLNDVGWSVVQVISPNYDMTRTINVMSVPETGKMPGERYYNYEHAHLCLLRKVS